MIHKRALLISLFGNFFQPLLGTQRSVGSGLFILFMFTLAVTAAASEAGLTLVKNGKSNAEIVIPSDAPQAKQAAAELQKYVKKMSGAQLPVIAEGKEKGEPITILVGHTAAAKKLGVNIPSGYEPSIRPGYGEEEGYVLKTKGKKVIMAGNSEGPYQGTLYAVYAFLEKLGCRWYFPGAWGEVVPKNKTVSIPPLDIERHPDFAIRDAGIKAYGDNWKTKVGFSNRNLGYPLVGDGFLGYLVPPDEYFEEHPEYFAMGKDGKRHRGRHPRHTMLCLSNDEMYEEAVRNLKLAFQGKKKSIRCAGEKGFGISPPDGQPFCYCESCLEASQNFHYPKYFPERMMSEEYFGFAARLAREFPKKWTSTMAYSLRVMPPQGVELPPNVAVNVFPITTCALHAGTNPGCWRRQETLKIISGWRELTPHVVVRHYVPGLLSVYGAGQRAVVPERDSAVFGREASVLKEMGVKGCTAAAWGNAGKSFMATWLSYYIRGKLTWDVDTDVDGLKRDFYTKFFGREAGAHVRRWWDACEDALGRSTCHAHEDWVAVKHIYTVPFTKKIHKHVEAATRAKASAQQRERIKAFALIADHLEAYAAMNEAISRLDYSSAIKASERMVEDVRKLNEIYEFFGAGNPSKKQTKELKSIAARVDGNKGSLVAPLPLNMRFTRDRFNEGILAEWYAPEFDDSAWGTENSFLTWDQQDEPEDAKGHDYDGYGWYRGEIEIDDKWADKPMRLYIGGIINEGWVWVNGKYLGHKNHKLWWGRPHEFDMEITELIEPGQRNTVAIRVFNDAEIGGLYRRGFIWAPKEGGK
ncbi:MAG: DUF4838 domain-containing protein [Candidatus Brocadiia bacterium]